MRTRSAATGRRPKRFDWMLAHPDVSLRPDQTHWAKVVHAHGRGGAPLECLRVILRMQLQQPPVLPSLKTYNRALLACACAADASTALEVVADMQAQDRPVALDRFGWNMLLEALATGGDMANAEAWFDRMRQSPIAPDLESYGYLISGYRDAKRFGEALRLFEDAIRTGVCAPTAGFDRAAKSVDFHRYAMEGKARQHEESGMQPGLALTALDWHLAQGHVDHRTQFIVGQGGGVLRDAVLKALAERGLHYTAADTNPGLLVRRFELSRTRPLPATPPPPHASAPVSFRRGDAR